MLISKIQSKLINLIKNYKLLTPFNRRLKSISEITVSKYKLQKWFNKIPAQRNYHQEIIKFIENNLKKDDVILETGCGIGQTLATYHHHGFKKLIGVEKDHPTYLGAKYLLNEFNVPTTLHNLDGLEVETIIENNSVSIYLPLNWTYFIEDFDKVFKIGSNLLIQNGFMIIDFIQKDYNPQTIKEKKTYDLYPFKHDITEIQLICQKYELKIIKIDDSDLPRVLLYIENEKNN